MITNIAAKIKYLSQKIYSEFLDSISFHKLTCSCGISGNLIKHAYYNRSIKTPVGLVGIRILRVKCKCCGKTHAIFPECIVPYSQILLEDHIKIVIAYIENSSFQPIMMTNLLIDESNIRYIINKYLHHWKEKIAAFLIPMGINLSYDCLCSFKRQFMQIKCIPNILSL
jgi:hypothetical protein